MDEGSMKDAQDEMNILADAVDAVAEANHSLQSLSIVDSSVREAVAAAAAALVKQWKRLHRI